jgi:hypothetical protein
MKNLDLKALRDAVGLAQLSAAEQIHHVTGGRASRGRKALAEAEKKGTDSLSLIEGMSLVYNQPIITVIEANRHTQAQSAK